MKKYILKITTAFIFLLALTSCKQRNEFNETNQTNLESIACDSIKYITNAFPLTENYKGYKLTQVVCLQESKGLTLTYQDNRLSRLDIEIRDVRVPNNNVFLIDTKQTYELAQSSYSKNTKVSTLTGEFASVHMMDTIFDTKDSIHNGIFQCILKEHYAFQISINKNKNIENQKDLENFITNYISKIDLSKLK